MMQVGKRLIEIINWNLSNQINLVDALMIPCVRKSSENCLFFRAPNLFFFTKGVQPQQKPVHTQIALFDNPYNSYTSSIILLQKFR